MEDTKLFNSFLEDFKSSGISNYSTGVTQMWMLPETINGQDVRILTESMTAQEFENEFLNNSVYQNFSYGPLIYSSFAVTVTDSSVINTEANIDYAYALLINKSQYVSLSKLTTLIQEGYSYTNPSSFEVFALDNNVVDAIQLNTEMLEDIINIGSSTFFGQLYDINGDITIEVFDKADNLVEMLSFNFESDSKSFLDYTNGRLAVRDATKNFLSNIPCYIDYEFDNNQYTYVAKLIGLNLGEDIELLNEETLIREFPITSSEFNISFDGGYILEIV